MIGKLYHEIKRGPIAAARCRYYAGDGAATGKIAVLVDDFRAVGGKN
jgi:hypothetical protein